MPKTTSIGYDNKKKTEGSYLARYFKFMKEYFKGNKKDIGLVFTAIGADAALVALPLVSGNIGVLPFSIIGLAAVNGAAYAGSDHKKELELRKKYNLKITWDIKEITEESPHYYS